jgi:hypothetical protein
VHTHKSGEKMFIKKSLGGENGFSEPKGTENTENLGA